MKIKDFFWIAFGFAIIGSLIYKIARNSFTEYFLGDNPIHTKAVIINEKNFMGNQPVKPKYSYSYQFIVNGEKFTSNAHDKTLKIGDTVEIEYNKNHLSINKPINPKD